MSIPCAEEWRATSIPGYEVSSFGRVRSLDRVYYQLSRHGTSHKHRIVGRILRSALTSAGYLSVVVGRSIGTRTVHSLVAEAFLGPRPDGFDIDHIDQDKQNNTPSNLRYLPRSLNNLNSKNRCGVTRISKSEFAWRLKNKRGSDKFVRGYRTFDSAKTDRDAAVAEVLSKCAV